MVFSGWDKWDSPKFDGMLVIAGWLWCRWSPIWRKDKEGEACLVHSCHVSNRLVYMIWSHLLWLFTCDVWESVRCFGTPKAPDTCGICKCVNLLLLLHGALADMEMVNQLTMQLDSTSGSLRELWYRSFLALTSYNLRWLWHIEVLVEQSLWSEKRNRLVLVLSIVYQSFQSFLKSGFLLFVTGQRTIFDSVNICSVWPWQQTVWALQQGRKVMVFVVTDFSYDVCGSQCLHKKSKLTVFIWQFSLMPHAGGNTGW
jgi:hypothetical protein